MCSRCSIDPKRVRLPMENLKKRDHNIAAVRRKVLGDVFHRVVVHAGQTIRHTKYISFCKRPTCEVFWSEYLFSPFTRHSKGEPGHANHFFFFLWCLIFATPFCHHHSLT